jgi:hypothetical protein
MQDSARLRMPAVLRRLDGWLLRHYPVVWVSRLHVNIPVAALLLVAVVVLGALLGRDLGRVFGPERSWAYQFGILLAALVMLSSVVQSARWMSDDLERAPGYPAQEAIRFALLVVWSFMLCSIPIATAFGARALFSGILWQFGVAASIALWLAAICFLSPLLVVELLGRAPYAILRSVGIALAAYAPMIVLAGLGMPPPTWSIAVVGTIVIGLNGLIAKHILRSPVVRKFIGVVFALAIPPSLGIVAAALITSNDSPIVFGTTCGFSTICLLPFLPRLRRQYQDVIATPEGPRPQNLFQRS